MSLVLQRGIKSGKEGQKQLYDQLLLPSFKEMVDWC